MRKLKKSKEINDKIEEKRALLNKKVVKENASLSSPEVISISNELDKLFLSLVIYPRKKRA